MRVFVRIFLSLLFLCGLVSAQNLLTLQAPAPGPARGVGVSVVGSRGNATYCYWIVAHYPIGAVYPSDPTCVINAPNTLTSQNYVSISWAPQLGATSYDVLRTLTPFPKLPFGAQCNCNVGSTSSASIVDNGAALAVYFYPATTPGANWQMQLNNRDYTGPRLVHNGPPWATLPTDSVTFGDGSVQTTAGGSASLPSTSNLFKGNGSGGALDSGINPANVAGWTRSGTTTSTTDTVSMSGTLLQMGCSVSAGTGSPEGVITGSVCDIWKRTNGGSGTVLYVKESGTATNTGWIAYGAGVGGSPGGSTTQVQYNSAGVFGGDPTFVFDATNKSLSLTNLGNQIVAPALKVTKAAASISGIDVIGADSAGFMMRFYQSVDVSPDHPTAYLKNGSFYTRGTLLVSGSTTGSGASYNGVEPTTDPNMIGIYSDVNGPSLAIKSSDAANGAYAILSVDHSGNYRWSLEELGTVKWGAGSTRASMDTGLSRAAAKTLAIGDGTDGDLTGTLKLTSLCFADTTCQTTAVNGFTCKNYKACVGGASVGGAYYGITTSTDAANDILYYANATAAITGTLYALNLNGNASVNVIGIIKNNNSSAVTAAATMQLLTANGGGAPQLALSISGVQDYWVCQDPQSSNIFKIGYAGGGCHGSTGAITVSTAGAITLVGATTLSAVPKFAGTNTTGSGSAALGANSPATTNTAPYTWVQITTSDGSTAYVPAWK